MAYIGRQSGQIGNYIRCNTITPDGSTTTFALTNVLDNAAVAPGSENNVLCSISGVMQAPSTAFTINGTNIVFSEAPDATDTVDFVLVLGETVAIGTPSNDTVSTAHLKADSVTKDKTEFISDGTAGLEIKGDGSSVDGYIQLNCHVNTHGVKIKAPPHSAGASYTLILPNDTGSNGQVLSTNGSGTLSFIDAVETKPTITSSSITIAPSSDVTFSLAGTNFVSVPIVELISSTGAITRASSVTFNSATSLTVGTNLAAGSYFVRVENNDGNAVRSSSAILSSSQAPNWVTGAGSLGTIAAGATQSFTLLAYDDDSTAITSYSLQSGSLPGGFTLDGDSSIGTISGTETGSSATTTYTFTIRATDDDGQTTDREFTITVTHGAAGGAQFN